MTTYNGYLGAPARKTVAPRLRIKLDDGVQVVEAVEEPQGRKIWGTCMTATPSSHGAIVNPRGCQARVPLPLYSEHGQANERKFAGEKAQIGSVYALRITPEKVQFKAVLTETFAATVAWELITSGAAKCVSVNIEPSHSATKLKAVDGMRVYEWWWMSELSIVRAGACPDAVIVGHSEL